jgi:aarF domain-containing kinase
MKGFNVSFLLSAPPRTGLGLGGNSWTCRKCLAQTQIIPRTQGRGYGTKRNAYTNYARPRRRVLLAAAGGFAAAGTGIAFTDDIRHGYEAVERTGRVVSTLGVCINE